MIQENTNPKGGFSVAIKAPNGAIVPLGRVAAPAEGADTVPLGRCHISIEEVPWRRDLVRDAELLAEQLRAHLDSVFMVQAPAVASLTAEQVRDVCKKLLEIPHENVLVGDPPFVSIEPPAPDGTVSFTFSMHTQTPVRRLEFSMRQPEGMSDEKFKQLCADMVASANEAAAEGACQEGED